MTPTSSDTPNTGIQLFTIGFTGKSAEQFFSRLQKAGVRLLIDTRLNNVSQLAGFTKRRDLEYFLKGLANIAYIHDTELAPTEDILTAYKKKRIAWEEYEKSFNALLQRRAPADHRQPSDIDRACLLCSEPTPEHCHRRLVAEYFMRAWPQVEIRHL